MFRREMKVNRAAFWIWTAALTVLLAGIAAAYPYIINEEMAETLDRMMAIFPQGILKAFNMDVVSIAKASGWIETEGLTLYLLAGSLYAAILGAGILCKEQSDGTAEYLLSLPVSRTNVVLSHYFAGLVYVLLMALIVGGATAGVLLLTKDFPAEMPAILGCAGLVFAAVYSLAVAISATQKRTRAATGLALALVAVAYALSLVGQLGEKTEFLRRWSLFSLCDARAFLRGTARIARRVATACLISAGSLLAAVIVYNRKNLV